MEHAGHDVVGEEGMIITPKPSKADLKQVSWYLDPHVVVEIDEHAKRTGRTRNECAELLLRWALDHEREELRLKAADEASPSKRKRES